jgi:gluconate kinase
MAARRAHFFKPSMLDSQLATLEEPEPDEDILVVEIGGTPDEIADAIVAGTGVAR